MIDLVEAGEIEPRRVEATSLRFEGNVQATWHVEADWLAAVTSYRISEEEFSARVLDTVETDPDLDADADGPHAFADGDGTDVPAAENTDADAADDDARNADGHDEQAEATGDGGGR
ncbi:hypothetical protein ACFQFH_18470 [Halobaculum halobium]